MSSKTKYTLTGLSIFVVLIGAVGIYLWQKSQNNNLELIASNYSTSKGGTIAALNSESLKLQPPDTQNPNPTSQEVESAQTIVQPYGIQLPTGWTKTDTKTEDNKCGDGKKWITDTYTKEAETLTIYENGHPGGCGKTIVADTYLDFNYKSDFSGLTVDTSSIKQCSKTDNPDCPIGDGVVDLLIGNLSQDNPDNSMVNSKNGNTYYFRLVDTKIDKDDFENQIKGLSSIVQLIQF